MRSIAWWHFQWPWRTLNPVFKVTAFSKSNISKMCILEMKLLMNTNRKPYSIYLMVPLSMTLSVVWPGFQGHDILTLNISETIQDWAIVTIERQYEVICTLSNGDISKDLVGPLTWFSRLQHFWSQTSQIPCILRTVSIEH